ncbi:hypothetical protein DFQ66_14810 [Salmonella enterica subsp. enterica serovar Amager]|nr:hypothetical protein [Salmonella enterica subsp. enterica serovar Amager]
MEDSSFFWLVSGVPAIIGLCLGYIICHVRNKEPHPDLIYIKKKLQEITDAHEKASDKINMKFYNISEKLKGLGDKQVLIEGLINEEYSHSQRVQQEILKHSVMASWGSAASRSMLNILEGQMMGLRSFILDAEHWRDLDINPISSGDFEHENMMREYDKKDIDELILKFLTKEVNSIKNFQRFT